MIESFKIPSATFHTLTGSIVTFNSQYAGLPLKSHKIALTATQSGSGTPSPDNVRTINGYSEINNNACGVNLWDEKYLEGYYNSSGVFNSQTGQLCTKNKIAVKPSTNYYLGTSINLIRTNTAICYYDKSGTIINRAFVGKGVFTTPSNCYYININFGSVYGGTYLNDLCVNYPSTDTDYHAYNGAQYTKQLGDTVYGGEYDARTGVLTVTHGIYILSGNETWSVIGSGTNIRAFIANVVPNKKPYANGICNCFKYGSAETVGEFDLAVDYLRFNVYGIATTSAEFNTWITNHSPITVIYELATPTTIQLPPCPIDTLEGVNNIFADTGDVDLTYYDLGIAKRGSFREVFKLP